MQERQRAQLSRFYVSDQLLNSHGVYQLSTEDSKHLMKVLRLGVGDTVELVDGSGRLQKGQVSTASKSSAVVCVCVHNLSQQCFRRPHQWYGLNAQRSIADEASYCCRFQPSNQWCASHGQGQDSMSWLLVAV